MENSMVAMVTGLIIFLAVLVNLPVKKMAKRIIGNDYRKAYIELVSGSNAEWIKGKLVYESSQGMLYAYKSGGEKSVIVSGSYPYEFIEGRRHIRVMAGDARASALGTGVKYSEGVVDVSNLVFGHQVADVLNSVEVGGIINAKTIGIGVVVVLVVVVVYFIQKGGI